MEKLTMNEHAQLGDGFLLQQTRDKSIINIKHISKRLIQMTSSIGSLFILRTVDQSTNNLLS